MWLINHSGGRSLYTGKAARNSVNSWRRETRMWLIQRPAGHLPHFSVASEINMSQIWLKEKPKHLQEKIDIWGQEPSRTKVSSWFLDFAFNPLILPFLVRLQQPCHGVANLEGPSTLQCPGSWWGLRLGLSSPVNRYPRGIQKDPVEWMPFVL